MVSLCSIIFLLNTQTINMLQTDLKKTSALLTVCGSEYERKTFGDIPTVLDLLNILIKWITGNLISNGKFSFKFWKIIPMYKAAKAFVEGILQVWPKQTLIKRLSLMPMGIGGAMIDYISWCLENVVNENNKISISLLKILPFIAKTIVFIRSIVSIFKAKKLI